MRNCCANWLRRHRHSISAGGRRPARGWNGPSARPCPRASRSSQPLPDSLDDVGRHRPGRPWRCKPPIEEVSRLPAFGVNAGHPRAVEVRCGRLPLRRVGRAAHGGGELGAGTGGIRQGAATFVGRPVRTAAVADLLCPCARPIPDVIVLLPCGFDLARTRQDVPLLTGRVEGRLLKSVHSSLGLLDRRQPIPQTVPVVALGRVAGDPGGNAASSRVRLWTPGDGLGAALSHLPD